MFVARTERALRAIDRDMLGAPFSVMLGGCVEDSFVNCIASLGAVTQFSVVQIGAHCGLIGIPDMVIDKLVEFALGGDGSEAGDDARGPTALGLGLGARLTGKLAEACAPVIGVALYGTTEMPGEKVRLNTQALACGFTVEAGGQTLGAIGLLLPLRALAEIESGSGHGGNDRVWASRIESALAQARITLRAVLARPVLSAGEFARLAPGTVIPIPALNDIAMIAGGFRIATGVADARDGRAGVRIQKTESAA